MIEHTIESLHVFDVTSLFVTSDASDIKTKINGDQHMHQLHLLMRQRPDDDIFSARDAPVRRAFAGDLFAEYHVCTYWLMQLKEELLSLSVMGMF